MTITISSLLQGAIVTPLPVSSGGTGVTGVTGIISGNGAAPMSAAVSGTDIKTLNGSSLLGSGNITIQPIGATMYLAQFSAI